jgi:hypothetical protein
MKKTEASKPTGKESNDMLPEYKFNYSKARPNRFATQIQEEDVTVTLDPDVSKVFRTSESVNSVLRALIETMPKTKGRSRTRNKLSDQKSG